MYLLSTDFDYLLYVDHSQSTTDINLHIIAVFNTSKGT